jgi:hypothetical protein
MLHLGYGSKATWGLRMAIFAGYGLIAVWLGLSWWSLITAASCVLLFLLSNTKLTASVFVWKICEGAFGALIGISLAVLMAGSGWVWGR